MGNIKKRVAILNDMYKDKVDVADFGPGKRWNRYQSNVHFTERLMILKAIIVEDEANSREISTQLFGESIVQLLH